MKLFNILWIIENVFTLYGGGGDKGGGDAPDYTELAAASRYAAQVAKELGNRQLDMAGEQYDRNMAVSEPVVQAQLALMNQQQAQGDDYFNYMKAYSRPAEQSLFYEAMGFTPEEVAAIEDFRAQETASFRQNQQTQQQATIPTTFSVPTYSIQDDVPEGAIKGDTLGNIRIKSEQTPLDPRYIAHYGMGAAGLMGKNTLPTKANPDAYYIKNKDGTYSVVDAKQKIVEGSKNVTVNTPQGNGSYSMLQTPETDAMMTKMAAEASARKKAEDAASRQQLTDLNSTLANRIGESNVSVYNRNKADIDAETGMAIADARKGYSDTINQIIRQGLRYGYNPNKIASTLESNGTEQASRIASAANTTRTAATDRMYQRGVGQAGQMLTGGITDRNNKIQDEAINTAKKLDVAGLYRNLPGASQGAYGLSVNAGNSAVNNTMQPGNQLLGATQAAAGTILTGTGQQISGLGNIVNSQTSLANNNSGDAIWGSLGQVGGAAIAKWSDKNVKKNIKNDVNDKKALEGIKKTDVKSWEYDENKVEGQDKKRHIGAMAQDMKKNLGNEVSDGRMVDVVSAIGVNMAATKALAKEVDKLKGSKK